MLLSARKGGDGALFKAFEVDERQGAADFFANFLFREFFSLRIFFTVVVAVCIQNFFTFQSERNVFENIQVRKKRVPLKDRIDGALVRGEIGNILAVEQDLSACGHVEACDHAQRRRLAATGRAEKGDEFTFFNREIYVVDHKIVVIAFADVF